MDTNMKFAFARKFQKLCWTQIKRITISQMIAIKLLKVLKKQIKVL